MSLDALEVEFHLIIRKKETDAHSAAFGRGIARLCEGVEQTGSLNKACKEMGMAYSKAWRIMRNTEDSLGIKLLERHGAHGSVLTDDAKRLLHVFRKTELSLRNIAQDTLDASLREESQQSKKIAKRESRRGRNRQSKKTSRAFIAKLT